MMGRPPMARHPGRFLVPRAGPGQASFADQSDDVPGQPPTTLFDLKKELTHQNLLLEYLADQLAPEDTEWGVFPSDGHLAFFPGLTTTVLDFKTNTVTNSSGGTGSTFTKPSQPLQFPPRLTDRMQSLLLFVDQPVRIRIEPGQGFWPTQGLPFIAIPYRRGMKITMQSIYPTAMFLIASPSIEPPQLSADQGITLARVSDLTTVTKSGIAGVADSWSTLGFLPYEAMLEYPITMIGPSGTVISTFGWGQKTFLVHNTGAAALEVRLVGGVSLGYYVQVPADAEVQDPNTTPIYVPAGGRRLLRTSTNFGIMECQVRMPQAAAAAATTTVRVEFLALRPGVTDNTLSGSGPTGPDDTVANQATGAAVIAQSVTPNTAFTLERVEVHFGAKPVTAGDIIVTMTDPSGAYSTVVGRIDPSMGVIGTDAVFAFGNGWDYPLGYSIDVDYANPDGETYHSQIFYEGTA